jgi:hypothetical protein
MSDIVLAHSDGTIVKLGQDATVWTDPDGKVSTEDRPLWPPRVYAARLVRHGFKRERRNEP